MKKFLACTITLTLLSACATMQDRPTVDRMDRWFSKPKYVIEFESDKSPSELITALKGSDCQGDVQQVSGITPAGPTAFVSVSAQARFYADYGSEPDGMEWASMNIDSRQLYDSVMAVRAFPEKDGSRVTVTPVRSGIDTEIQSSLESGSLFCDWRDFVNKWRM